MYKLENYLPRGKGSQHRCPECLDKRSFTLYVDVSTGEPLDETVGICNHKIKCQYHYTPSQYFKDKGIERPKYNSPYKRKEVKSTKASYIPKEYLKATLMGYGQNNFVQYLNRLFDPDSVKEVIEEYLLGTSKKPWEGSVVFWQIDDKGVIRDGKIMLYNVENGKRVKEPFPHITWAHSALKFTGYNLEQCLFGLHLLNKYSNKVVCLVESEKTAIIASIYQPDKIWLATGGISNVSPKMLKILKGRDVVLYPDLLGYEKWSKLKKNLSSICRVHISRLLEEKATKEEKEAGLDLADYLIRFPVPNKAIKDYRLKCKGIALSFKNQINLKSDGSVKSEAKRRTFIRPLRQNKKKVSWNDQIAELEEFFSGKVDLINFKDPIELNKAEIVIDVAKFVKKHLATLKANNGTRAFEVYLERLALIATRLGYNSRARVL